MRVDGETIDRAVGAIVGPAIHGNPWRRLIGTAISTSRGAARGRWVARGGLTIGTHGAIIVCTHRTDRTSERASVLSAEVPVFTADTP
jgi:hypothetical protein